MPKGERQQHRHAGRRADAGQRADQDADQHARDRHHHVERRQRHAKAHREVG
jgi:hypothetical protein